MTPEVGEMKKITGDMQNGRRDSQKRKKKGGDLMEELNKRKEKED